MKYLFVFCFVLVCANLNAQNYYPSIVWDKDYGGTGFDGVSKIITTLDGGALICGYTDGGPSFDVSQPDYGGGDYWIIRVNSSGVKLWDKRYGGSSAEWLYDAVATSDGGFLLAGGSSSDISGSKTQNNWSTIGSFDYWIVKIDSNGNQEWDRDYGSNLGDYFTSVAQTGDGGYVLGGYTQSGVNGNKTQPSWGGDDYWIVKVDSNGDYQWDKRFGGTGQDRLFSVKQTFDNGYLLSGYSGSSISGDKTQNNWGFADFWVVRTDSLGIKLWDKRIGSTSSEQTGTIVLTSDGGFAIAGLSHGGPGGDKTTPNYGNTDYWLVRCDADGTVLWDKTFGGSQQENFSTHCSLGVTPQGSFFISGWSYSDSSGNKTENNLTDPQGWMVVTDSNGNKLWDKTILTSYTGLTDRGCAMAVDQDGFFWVGTTTAAGIGGNKTQPNYGGVNPWDVFVLKLNDTSSYLQPLAYLQSSVTKICPDSCISFGNQSTNATSYEWLFQGGNPNYSTDEFPNICYNTSGFYDVTLIAHNGPYSDTTTSTNLIEVYTPPSPTLVQSNDTVYVTNPQSGDSYQWSFNGGILTGATNDFYVATTSGLFTVSVTNASGCSGSSELDFHVGIESTESEVAFELFPNPAGALVTVSLSTNQQAIVTLYNTLGQSVYTGLVTQRASIDLSQLPDGLYLLSARTDNDVITKRLVVSR